MQRGRFACAARRFTPALLTMLLATVPARTTSAQTLPAIAGAAGGFVAGVSVSTAIVVLQARLGRYVYGLDELMGLRPEILPIFAGPVVGAILGATSSRTLGRAGVGAAIGSLGGVAIGVGIGQLLWKSSEGRWAGGIIFGAAGLLAGAVVNAWSASDPGSDPPVTATLVSIRAPWDRR